MMKKTNRFDMHKIKTPNDTKPNEVLLPIKEVSISDNTTRRERENEVV